MDTRAQIECDFTKHVFLVRNVAFADKPYSETEERLIFKYFLSNGRLQISEVSLEFSFCGILAASILRDLH